MDYGPLHEQDPDEIKKNDERKVDFDDVSFKKAMVRIESELQQKYSDIVGIWERVKETGWGDIPDHVKMLLQEEASSIMEKLTKIGNLKKSIRTTEELQDEWENKDIDE